MPAKNEYTTDELFQLADMLDKKHPTFLHKEGKYRTILSQAVKQCAPKKVITRFLKKSYGYPFWDMHEKLMLSEPLKGMPPRMNDIGDSGIIAKWRLNLGR